MPQNGHGTPVTVRSGHGGPSVDGNQGRTAATASIPAPATRSGLRSIPSEEVLSSGAGASAIAGVAGVGTVAMLTTGERSSRELLSYPRAVLAATTRALIEPDNPTDEVGPAATEALASLAETRSIVAALLEHVRK